MSFVRNSARRNYILWWDAHGCYFHRLLLFVPSSFVLGEGLLTTMLVGWIFSEISGRGDKNILVIQRVINSFICMIFHIIILYFTLIILICEFLLNWGNLIKDILKMKATNRLLLPILIYQKIWCIDIILALILSYRRYKRRLSLLVTLRVSDPMLLKLDGRSLWVIRFLRWLLQLVWARCMGSPTCPTFLILFNPLSFASSYCSFATQCTII